MKVSKKILSILLAVCLLVACLPLSTSAAENDQSLQIMQEMMDEYNTLEVESSMHENSEQPKAVSANMQKVINYIQKNGKK